MDYTIGSHNGVLSASLILFFAHILLTEQNNFTHHYCLKLTEEVTKGHMWGTQNMLLRSPQE